MKRPVYNHTPEYAREHNELEQYRESNRLNERCARVVEREIDANFDGAHLNRNAVQNAIEQCGMERLQYVLAFTVQWKDWDGRFGRDVKEWAKRFDIQAATEWSRFIVESHPAVLDGFIRGVIRNG